MSEIRANTISDAAGTGPIDLHKQSAAKAWVNFDQDPVTLADSANVSSLTDNTVADHTVNFSTSFSNARYASAGAAQALTTSDGSTQAYPLFTISGHASPTATTSRIIIRGARSAYGAFDYNNVTACYHGDLA